MRVYAVIELNEDYPLEEIAVRLFLDKVKAREAYHAALDEVDGVSGAQVLFDSYEVVE